jgi:hypothetical protein
MRAKSDCNGGLRPGNQTQFVHLHQAWVRGHDAHAKAIGAAFRSWDCSLVNIIAVAIPSSLTTLSLGGSAAAAMDDRTARIRSPVRRLLLKEIRSVALRPH